MSRIVCVIGWKAAGEAVPSGQGHVDTAGFETARRRLFDGGAARLEGGFELGAQRIGGGGDRATFGGRQLTQAAQDLRHGALTAEICQPPGLDRRRVCGG